MDELATDALVKDGGRAVNDARRIMLFKRLGRDPPDAARLHDAILSHEVAIIRRWKYAFDASAENRGQKNRLHELCGDCLELLKALPDPASRADRTLHRLRAISYAYLGERWEEARELAGDAELETAGRSSEWRLRVFESIASTVMLLAKKTNLADLDRAEENIERLRQEQGAMEGPYLEGVDAEYRRAAACELASLYHLAQCVETAAGYMKGGSTGDIGTVLDMQFDKAFSYCQRSGQKDLEFVERMLHLTLKKMAENSVWAVASRVAFVKEFAGASLKSSKPVFELLYPQRAAVLDRGLLDPASRAAVVAMPTSSGKTLMAELRIIQAVMQDKEAWAAYVAPTRALVNQIAGRLRRSLGGLGLRVEKMSGAIDMDAFEKSMTESADRFQVLVLTPEKMSMLIKRDRGLRESLALAVIDEAHNLADRSRGLNLEMLLATIKSDCSAGLLLLTPFLPNGEEVARWLDPRAPRLIEADLGWKPGGSAVGLYYPKGRGRDVSVYFEPLLYFSSVGAPPAAPERQAIKIGDAPAGAYTRTRASKKYAFTSIAAARLAERGNVLIVTRTMADTWRTAKELQRNMKKLDAPGRHLSLVKKFVGAELGEAFPLAGCLDYGIGVHNAGLPDDVRQLVEWLMGENHLKVLVSTTTTAQGVDFPVSSVLLPSYRHRYSEMRPDEFLNIAGRAGRVGQQGIGLVGVATDGPSAPKAAKAEEFVRRRPDDVDSVMESLIKRRPGGLDLHALASEPEWSSFVQYVAHTYNQSGDLDDFASRVEASLRNTYGYHRIGGAARRELIAAVDEYGKHLDGRKEFSRLSDMTGFSPETVEGMTERVASMNMKESDWSGSGLFSGSARLSSVMKEMVEGMPEIRGLSEIKAAKTGVLHDALGGIISDWVSGKPIPDISEAHFGGIGEKPIQDCVAAIYGKISQYATWGLSAMHQIYRENDGSQGVSNLPAMVYYGVDSDEAVLMRMNSMPRGISASMGKAYVRDSDDLYGAKSGEVVGWLNDLNDSEWDSAVRRDAPVSGGEYKQIWRKLAGLD